MCGFKSVLLTKSNFEKLEAKYFQKFETVISCLLSYVEFKIEAKDSLFGNPKMNGFGLSGAKNSMEFLASNSVANSTELLFPKHSRCGMVCKVAKFYLAPNLEITALWSALFKNFSPDQPPEGMYFKRCFFNWSYQKCSKN